MISPILRGLAAALLLATVVATDALPVFPASRQRCDMACCRLPGAMGHGDSCQVRRAAGPRCTVGMSSGLPVSFQSQREMSARTGLRASQPGDVILAPAGRVAETTSTAPPSLPFEPPVPPPRSLRFA